MATKNPVDGKWIWQNEPRIRRITDNPELSLALKASKLQTMALRCVPSSPMQRMVKEAWLSIQMRESWQ
jgi:hypothetical protein